MICEVRGVFWYEDDISKMLGSLKYTSHVGFLSSYLNNF